MVNLSKDNFLKLKRKIEDKIVYGEFFNSDKFFFSSLIVVVLIIMFHLRIFISNFYLSSDWNVQALTLNAKHKFWFWTTNESFPIVEIESPWYTNVVRALTFEKSFYENPFESLYEAIKGIFLVKQNWLTNFYVYKLFCEILLCVQFGYLAVRYNAATSYVICIINYNSFRFWLEALFRQIPQTMIDFLDDTYNYQLGDARNCQVGKETIGLPRGDVFRHVAAFNTLAQYVETDDEDYLNYDKEIIFHGALGTPGEKGQPFELAHTNSPYTAGFGKFPIFEDHSKLVEPSGPIPPTTFSGFSVWNKHHEELLRNMEDVNTEHQERGYTQEDMHSLNFETLSHYDTGMLDNPHETFTLLIDKVGEFFNNFIQLRVIIKDDHIEYINFYRDPISLALTSNGLYKQDNLIGLSHFVGYEVFLKWSFMTLNFMLYNYLNMFLFQSFNRRLKDFMPYLIRWHWTTHFLCNMFYVQLFMPLGITLNTYLHNDYQAYVEELILKKDPNAQLEMILYASADTIIHGLMTLYIPFAMFAGLHAILGQYFYLPGITSHVELHIGRREDTTVFAGGSMDWQKYAYADRRFMWYGMLGRGRDKKFILFSFFDFIKNLLIRFFKKFILFLKRD